MRVGIDIFSEGKRGGVRKGSTMNLRIMGNRRQTSDIRHQTSAERGKRKLNTNCECVILNLFQDLA
jgi:hypothetical protein